MSGDIEEIVSGRDVKLVVVGDGAVGKTCLCNVFVNREFPVEYEATIFENHSAKMDMDGTPVTLQLWDTAGQEGYDRIRILSYENTDCFVLCFSVVDSVSFANVKNLWLKELRENQPTAHILLVGTKCDLRGTISADASDARREEVTVKKLRRLVKEQKLSGYVETSAKRGGEDVDRVFHEAIRLALGQSTMSGVDGPGGPRTPQPWGQSHGGGCQLL